MNYLLCRTFGEFMSQPAIVIGLVFISLGIAAAVLARRIAMSICKIDEVPNDNRAFVATKIVGLALIVVGFACISLGIIFSY